MAGHASCNVCLRVVEGIRGPVCRRWIGSTCLVAIFAHIRCVQMGLIFASGCCAVMAVAAVSDANGMEEFGTCPTYIIIAMTRYALIR
jgi:hypothetical protein